MRHSQPFTPSSPFIGDDPMLGELSQRLDELSRRHGPRALRLSIGLVFAWFGVLKFFPSVSPAEQIAVDTLTQLTLSLVPGRALLLGLALFETGLGVCFMLGLYRRLALLLLIAHMCGTALPFFMFPAQLFSHVLVPTFLGQYILKNMIIVSAALALLRRWD
jgi:uncharacterized membrane protein YphA (DoxX/SURF4 family)